jgi:hypothetical protein
MIGEAGLDRAIAAVLRAQRAALTAEFGWTQLDLEASVRPGLLRLRGQVALPRVSAGVCRALAPLLPRGWWIDASAVQARAPIGWRAPGPGVTRLWRTSALALAEGVAKDMAQRACLEVQVSAGLSTELLPGDGPVALLAELPGCALVRAGDGTVGWIGRVRGALATAEPAGRRAPPRMAAEDALRRLGARLRSHLGVRYRLGGTTRRHIDCSGLVQRGVREALGLVLPRHSSDQLALGVAPVRPLGEPGDLLFMGGAEGAAWHVGVVLRGARPGSRTLLHASARRGEVVEEPLERGLLRAGGAVQHIELAQLLEGVRGS